MARFVLLKALFVLFILTTRLVLFSVLFTKSLMFSFYDKLFVAGVPDEIFLPSDLEPASGTFKLLEYSE